MTANVADPRPFIEHMSLATAWLRHNGRRVTEMSVSRAMRRFTVEQLRLALGRVDAEHARAVSA